MDIRQMARATSASRWMVMVWSVTGCGDEDQTARRDAGDSAPDTIEDITLDTIEDVTLETVSEVTTETTDTSLVASIDPVVGSWEITSAEVVSTTCPFPVAPRSGYLVVAAVDQDTGTAAFCTDADGNDCDEGLTAMPVTVGVDGVTLAYGYEWSAEHHACRLGQTGAGTLSIDGVHLALATIESTAIASGDECAEAEAEWQALHGNTLTLAGCEVVQAFAMTRTQVPRPEVTVDTYPRVDGSTSNLPLARAIASELFGLAYRWRWPNGDFVTEFVLWPVAQSERELTLVDTVLGIVHHRTDEAFLRLIDGETDFILVANPPSPDERAHADALGVTLALEPIALDALIFMVSADNPITALTTEQIQKIYTGEITRWSEVGGRDVVIHPYSRPENSGSQQLMQALVMGDLQMAEWPNAQYKPTTMSDLVDRLRVDHFGVGYSVFYYVTHQYPIDGLKLIAVDGRSPNRESIADRSYPFTAPVFAGIRADLDAASLARQLRDWLRGEDGQRVVRRVGYVPALPAAPVGGAVRIAEPTACVSTWVSGGELECDAWSSADNAGCPPDNTCAARWDEACEVYGQCLRFNPAPPGLDEPCSDQCGSGLVCWTARCRPICDPWPGPGQDTGCAAGEHCFYRSPDVWHPELAPVGWCDVSCTPADWVCAVGEWCAPGVLDPDTDEWVGTCGRR